MTAQAFYQMVMRTSGDDRRERAKRATATVFHALRDRLTEEESDPVVDQLPTELKEIWRAGEKAERRPVKLRRAEFFERDKDEMGAASAREARWITLAVFAALKEQLSPGEAEDVLAQLPRDLKEEWASNVAVRVSLAPGLKPLVGEWLERYKLRGFGSVALHLAYAAIGALDVLLDHKATLWDLAAGAVLVLEAGGAITDPLGRPLFPVDPAVYRGEPVPFVAGNVMAHAEAVARCRVLLGSADGRA